MKDIIIGSHVNMSGSELLLGSVKQALSYGANTFMFYTGAPQNTIRKPMNPIKESEWSMPFCKRRIYGRCYDSSTNQYGAS